MFRPLKSLSKPRPNPKTCKIHKSNLKFSMMAAAATTTSSSSTTTSNPPNDPNPKLKILMLHGYTQSGPLFALKTKALKKNLEKSFPPAPKPGHLPNFPGGVELFYPTAPLKLLPSDIPGYDVDGSPSEEDAGAYGWWKRRGDSEPYTYEGLDEGLARLAEVIRTEGPFHGVIGFSQGGAAAGMLASLLERGRREGFEALREDGEGGMEFPAAFEGIEGEQGELRFAVSYSGFGASAHPLYRGFYRPKIRTPMLHFLGSVDTVVEEERSLRLVEACEEGNRKGRRVVYHPGGHFLPSSQKEYVAALIAFIREVVGEGAEGEKKKGEEESVEDMDVPF